MPKVVNRADRRVEICAVAMRILASKGASALTLRSLAAELNGSITLVTHFFDDRDDLIVTIVDDLAAYYREVFDSLERFDDPADDLRAVLTWILPEGSEEDEREAVRVALIPLRDTSKGVKHFFDAMETSTRQMLADPVSRLAGPDTVATIVDALRASMNGLVLSFLEHPQHWTRARRLAVIDFLVDGAVAAAAKSPIGSSSTSRSI